jgi:hypothetical protein
MLYLLNIYKQVLYKNLNCRYRILKINRILIVLKTWKNIK